MGTCLLFVNKFVFYKSWFVFYKGNVADSLYLCIVKREEQHLPDKRQSTNN